ncbi:MAG: hypothetical protein ACQEP0_09475 [Natrinema limicola]
MTNEFADDGLEERLDFRRDERSSSRPDSAVHAAGPPRRVVTDGGQAEVEEPEAETTDSDAEGEVEDAPESEQIEGEDEDEIEEPEVEEEAAEPEAEVETAEEAEEDEYHIEDADDVYQDEAVAGVLHLDLDGLFLDLLGLEVNLNPVTLDVSARPGESNLLGTLLAAVSGLFDGSSGMLETEGEDAEPGDDSPGRISSAVGWFKEKLAALVPSFPTEEVVAAIVSEVIEQVVERLEPERTDTSGERADPSQAEVPS